MKKLFIIIICFLVGCKGGKEVKEVPAPLQEISIESSKLVVDEELPLVLANCTPCHSEKLITQNRATREGWKEMIEWMQQTQNLWPLGENEGKILDYLERNYSPTETGRRKPLQVEEWYELQ